MGGGVRGGGGEGYARLGQRALVPPPHARPRASRPQPPHSPFLPLPQGLEQLLGGAAGGAFDLEGGIWNRKASSAPPARVCGQVVLPLRACVGVGGWVWVWARPRLIPLARTRRSPHTPSLATHVPPPSLAQGWADMDKLREKLEDVKELRDLVRSLGRRVLIFFYLFLSRAAVCSARGRSPAQPAQPRAQPLPSPSTHLPRCDACRGGGWGPLRRAPIQYLDMKVGRKGGGWGGGGAHPALPAPPAAAAAAAAWEGGGGGAYRCLPAPHRCRRRLWASAGQRTRPSLQPSSPPTRPPTHPPTHPPSHPPTLPPTQPPSHPPLCALRAAPGCCARRWRRRRREG